MEKWQEQVEEILRDKAKAGFEQAIGKPEDYQDDQPSQWLKMTEELIELTRKVDGPSGDAGEFVVQVLNILGEKLCPVVAAYTAFRLGVAYERYQNANKA